MAAACIGCVVQHVECVGFGVLAYNRFGLSPSGGTLLGVTSTCSKCLRPGYNRGLFYINTWHRAKKSRQIMQVILGYYVKICYIMTCTQNWRLLSPDVADRQPYPYPLMVGSPGGCCIPFLVPWCLLMIHRQPRSH